MPPLRQTIKTYSKESSLTLLFSVFLLHALLFAAPARFPAGALVTIETGSTLESATKTLEEKNIVRSAFVLRGVVGALGSDTGIIAGDYAFERRYGVFGIARRILEGEYGLNPKRIVVFEGLRVTEIADLFDEYFERFDRDEFVKRAMPYEGYLFPDTYFFLPNTDAKTVFTVLHNTFIEKLEEVAPELEESDKPLEDIIIMASILEKEESDFIDKQKIAGILWKRIEIDMPLQVDAAVSYIVPRNTYELTQEDLALDDPYNTYRVRGLPPTPIASPGLDSIRAALDPIESEYLFYLADKRGNTYYAETFEEHKQNRRLYLHVE